MYLERKRKKTSILKDKKYFDRYCRLKCSTEILFSIEFPSSLLLLYNNHPYKFYTLSTITHFSSSKKKIGTFHVDNVSIHTVTQYTLNYKIIRQYKEDGKTIYRNQGYLRMQNNCGKRVKATVSRILTHVTSQTTDIQHSRKIHVIHSRGDEAISRKYTLKARSSSYSCNLRCHQSFSQAFKFP